VNPNEKLAFRVLFIAAAIYNIVFAAWSGLASEPFFAMVGAPVPDEWQFVAPIVGLFALCYAYAACWPERMTSTIAVGIGLASKIAGPQLWLVALMMGESTPRLFPLLLAGDLLWWLPFIIYLTRQLPSRATVPILWCFGIHLLANIYLLRISGGTELVESLAKRQAFVLEQTWLWVGTWLLWSLSSISLFGFCAAWATRIEKPRGIIAFALAVIAVGVAFDLCSETVLIVEATRPELAVAEFASIVRQYQYLGPGFANGLYCVGGLMLSILSWRAGFLRGVSGTLGLLVWVVGFGLTAAAFADHRLAMIACGGGVMLLFLPWSLLVAVVMLRTARGHSTERT
jgi:hypothetical protein